MTVILEAKSLYKTISTKVDQEHAILRNVSFQIMQGEFVAIMGPSGSGKSTLLYNISGMDRASQGEVYFQDQELTTLTENELSELRLNKMGFVFQQIHLLKNMCLLDNVVLPGFVANKASRKQVKGKAMQLMERVGLSGLHESYINQASGGQLQRAAICRALINEPAIIFGDEPTGALNTGASNEVLDILGEINEAGTTVIVVTHDNKVAAKSERVLYMVDGAIVAEKQLGKYNRGGAELQVREHILTSWLTAQGF